MKTTLLIVIVIIGTSINPNVYGQKKNKCKYPINEIDDFTKKRR